MKKIFKKIIVVILTIEAKLVLSVYRPKIIAVVGSVGKTSTKDALYTVLRPFYSIRKNKKSLNSEFGVPLTILNLDSGWGSPLHWLHNIYKGFTALFSIHYPEWLVLEIGTDRPGDMKRTASWVKPDIVVMTSLPDLPVHVEHFDSPKAVRDEDKKIIEYMKKNSVLVTNADDERTLALRETAKKRATTYGMNEIADVQFSHYSVLYETTTGAPLPVGISFKVNHDGNSIPVTIRGVLGTHHCYPVVASIATGLVLGTSILDLANAAKHTPPKGRMNLIAGVKDTLIIDDTYNAAPIAVIRAIEALDELDDIKGKKIFVMGDMVDLGHHAKSAHVQVGKMVGEGSIDCFLAVGDMAKEAIKAAKTGKPACVEHFETQDTLIEKLKEIIEPGSVVLVKGSQSSRMEKVVEKIMLNPEEKEELLVRQEEVWRHR
jgi:UDP-N-acetylmuramyl pentapeptide synthase